MAVSLRLFLIVGSHMTYAKQSNLLSCANPRKPANLPQNASVGNRLAVSTLLAPADSPADPHPSTKPQGDVVNIGDTTPASPSPAFPIISKARPAPLAAGRRTIGPEPNLPKDQCNELCSPSSRERRQCPPQHRPAPEVLISPQTSQIDSRTVARLNEAAERRTLPRANIWQGNCHVA